MRVITGTARGRKLREIAGNDIRPTSDLVKESLFNIIQFDIEGRRVLDLFAGTGQLGIEALSRGADSCVFVDESREAVMVIRANLAHCEIEGEVALSDAMKYLERASSRFDLIFIDPPYESSMIDKALAKIYEFDKLSEGGIMICESRSDRELPEAPEPYAKGREYRYGKVKLTVYTRTSN